MLNVNTGITIVTFNEKTLTAEFSTHTKAPNITIFSAQILKDEMNAFLNIIYCCYIYLPNTQSISNYVIKFDRFHEILE